MNAGKVDLLLIMGSNPVYDAPADLGFADAMNKVPLRVQHSLYQDETYDHVHWHINATHYLEQWGDVRTFDGTASLTQPLIAPLYGGKSEYEFIVPLVGSPETNGYEIVRKYWQGQQKGGDFETAWRKALYDGFFANTAAAAKTVAPKGGNIPATDTGSAEVMEVIFRRDPMIYDGSKANNGWLQERPSRSPTSAGTMPSSSVRTRRRSRAW